MRKFQRILFVLLSVALAVGNASAFDAAKAQSAIDNFASKKMMKNASLTIAVASVADGKIVASHNPDLAVITASTMKTVTSTAALEQLGADFMFETPVFLEGEVKNGVLKGNLLIVGQGDPTLGSRFFKDNLDIVPEIVAALKALGIKKIEGDIVVDESLYPYPAYNGWWDVGDLAWDYGMGVHSLNYHDNSVRLIFDGRNGAMTNARFDPPVSKLQLIDKLRGGTTDNVNLYEEYANPAVIVTGSVADTTYYFTVSNPVPSSMLVDSLNSAVKAAGVKVRHRSAKGDGQRWQLLVHRSPKLSDIISSLLERSDNMFTDALLRAVALNSGRKPVPTEGVVRVNELLKRLGVDTEPKFQYDGSGLARANKASGAFFTSMLSAMSTRRYGARQQRLVDLMPRVGVNARIGSILGESDLTGRIAVKSGSMTGVQCYVGYFPADNPEYCFSVLVNNWHGERASLKNDIDRLLLGVFGN